MLPTSRSPEGSSSSSSNQVAPPRPLEASKWLDFVFLVSEEELASLLKKWEEAKLYLSKGIYPRGEALYTKEKLLSTYKTYLSDLENGIESDLSPFYFYLTNIDQAVYHQPVDGGRARLYPVLPCFISQPGRLTYSSLDETFRVSAFGQDSLSWGLKWTFPQLYLDPTTREIMRGDRSPPSPNAALLEVLRRWIRDETAPVAFLVDGKKIQTPFRVGNALQGKFKHPLLAKRGIELA